MSTQTAGSNGKPSAVYRVFGDEDALLYIGVSDNFGQRWKQHAKVQPWWSDHHRMTVDWYDSREEAEDVETAAIKAEDPKYNITHSPRAAGRTRPRYQPDDRDFALEEARKKHDAAYDALLSLVRESLAAGRGPARIARHAGWTREYIAHIRDGKAGNGSRSKHVSAA